MDFFDSRKLLWCLSTPHYERSSMIPLWREMNDCVRKLCFLKYFDLAALFWARSLLGSIPSIAISLRIKIIWLLQLLFATCDRFLAGNRATCRNRVRILVTCFVTRVKIVTVLWHTRFHCHNKVTMSRPKSRECHGHEKIRDVYVTFFFTRDFFVTFGHEKVTFLLLVN